MTRILLHRVSPLIYTLIAVTLLVTFTMGDISLRIPRLASGDIKVRLFMPAILAAILAATASEPLMAAERISRRRIPLLLASSYFVVFVLIAVLFFSVYALTEDEIFLAVGRNHLMYCGVSFGAVSVLREVGPAASVLLTMLLVVIVDERSPRVISWVVRAEFTWVDLALAAAGAVAGLALWFLRNTSRK